MDNKKSTIRKLLQQYKSGVYTREELESLYRELSADEELIDAELWESLLEEIDIAKFDDQKFENLYLKIRTKTIAKHDRSKLKRLIPYSVAAAAVLLIGLFGLYQLKHQHTNESLQTTSKLIDVEPGGNKAVLKTADGTEVVLNEAEGAIVMGDEITYANGAKVGSVAEDSSEKIAMYELSTPNSGTYRVTLDDGSIVWLNAGSTLTYPSKFNEQERKVSIVGEAYFDIQKDANRAFKVSSNGQTVEVFGTSFNISAYPEEGEVRTTLVEGKVSVGNNDFAANPVFLNPGEQSILKEGGEIRVKQVNIMEQVAWRKGLFYFEETPLRVAMQQISRWYDIVVKYEGDVSHNYFYGQIPRTKSLQNVLNILEEGNVRFRLTKENSKYVLTVLSAQ